MKLAIMQPYLFPYIGYWQLINAVDTFIIYDDVNFIKKGFINRNSILVNNQAHQFTLELISASQNKLINEITIGNNQNKILTTIQRAYSNAPYFNEVFPLFRDILTHKHNNLSIFLGSSLIQIAKYLGIPTKFTYSSEIKKDSTTKGVDKILSICNKLNTSTYINAIGGQALYNKKNFLNCDIELKFLKPNSFTYKQFNDVFIPNLSIIDTLMFNSKESVQHIIYKNYELI